jgi:hypothetical protein
LETAINLTNVLKLLVAAADGFVCFMVLEILVIYSRMLKRGYKSSISRHHVWLAGLFVILSCSYASVEILIRLGHPMTFRAIFGISMAGTGVPSVLMVLDHLHKRRKETGT